MNTRNMKTEQIDQAVGLGGATLTGATATVTWIEQANHYIDAVAGIIAIGVGIATLLWQIQRIRKARGGASNDQDSPSD